MTAEQRLPTQHDAALHYVNRGFEVFPADPETKAPLTKNGMVDASSDAAQIHQWWTQHPDALIACRIPEDLVVLDIDPRHGGDSTWAELEHAYAPIVAGRSHKSGRNDGGEHHWFKKPAGKLSAKKLHEWARKNGTGHAAGKNSWVSGIDVLHHGHRYSILPPSLHPVTREPYLWLTRNEPADMPPFLAALIVADPPLAERPHLRPVHDSESIADWYTSHTSWHDLLPSHGWVLVAGNGDSDGSKWRHPHASAESSASVRHGCLFVYTPNTDFEQTEDGDPRGITRFRAWATLEHNGNMSDAARAAREMRDGKPEDVALANLIATGTPTVAPDVKPTSPLHLPEEFWLARPNLQHIRQAAHARTRSADAVLLFTLARVAAQIPPSVVLPAIVGGEASLNLIGAVVASSGAGKSTAGSVARALVPIDRKDVLADVPPGSGEGLAELYFSWEMEEDANGKKQKVKRQTKTGVYMYLDEGEAFTQMGKRQGATLNPTLRSAWGGETLGQSNAQQETHRVLKPHTYRLAIIIGFQIEYAADVLSDSVGGTPQRFIYAPATDPNVPEERPEWPGPISVGIPPVLPGGTQIDVDPDICAEIRARNLRAVRGESVPDTLDSHRDLVTLKVAALLGILDDRLSIEPTDWQLAKMVMQRSSAVRTWVMETARLRAMQNEDQRAVAVARREAIVEDDQTRRALESGAKSMARMVHNAGGVVPRGAIARAASGKHKQLVAADDMLAHALERGWLKEADGGYLPGEARPL